MGVSGSGKTTVAALLAAALGCQFLEGDDLHPRENVEKMRSGTPLTDADRLPWLRKIAEEIDGWRARRECGVLTCSALKRAYRNIIIGDRDDVVLVYLKRSPDLIHRRMAARAVALRIPKVRWGIGVLLGAGVLVNYFDRINLSVGGPQLQQDFGLTDSELGWLFSGLFWPYAVMQIPTGMILDRFGVTPVNRLSTFLWSVASTATAFA